MTGTLRKYLLDVQHVEDHILIAKIVARFLMINKN